MTNPALARAEVLVLGVGMVDLYYAHWSRDGATLTGIAEVYRLVYWDQPENERISVPRRQVRRVMPMGSDAWEALQ